MDTAVVIGVKMAEKENSEFVPNKGTMKRQGFLTGEDAEQKQAAPAPSVAQQKKATH